MKIGSFPVLILLAVACGFVGAYAQADNCSLAWSVNSLGGERMSGTNRIATVSIGQTTIGESASARRMAGLGVLSAEQSPPLVMTSPASAKLRADGKRVALGALVVTSKPGEFSDRIYAEAEDRSSGIALVNPVGEAYLTEEGSRVNVVGGAFTVNKERVIYAPMVAVLYKDDPLPALD